MSLIQTFPSGAGGSGDSIQVTTFPTASASELGNIYQYVGSTTLQYKNGCFYQCTLDSSTGTYSWEPIGVEAPGAYEDDNIDFNTDW